MSFFSWLLGGSPAAPRIDGTRAQELVSAGAVLLDVRTPAEFHAGHIKGAINIPVGELSRRLDELPSDGAVVVYCRSGARSARAARQLSTSGCEIHDLGPMHAW